MSPAVGALALARSPVGHASLRRHQSEPKLRTLGHAGAVTVRDGGFPSPARSGRQSGQSVPDLPAIFSPSKSPTGLDTRGTLARTHYQGVWGHGPPNAGAYRSRLDPRVHKKPKIFTADDSPVTEFRRFFERGDIPISFRHGAKKGIEWKVEPDKLDYLHYLPIFFDGIMEKQDPFATLAECGVYDMLKVGRHQVLKCIPSLIMPIKRSLDSRDGEIMAKMLCVLQQLVKSDEGVGEALVPYYRQLLPCFNLYKSANHNLGDKIYYAQRKRQNMGDLIEETLAILERHGGEDAFINIKYMIPTYESLIH
mmetsp:Transcript_22663/g.57913  ORF Transcript_22663/g.57913 Transcript_22663/m.57913 type:complete len:309 (-) Transcript_22663:13-939(-)